MSKISREDNKKRFKTGMYPTQQDFENVFDSYVHKDDTIDPSKIVSGDENIVDIINRKAEERHNHPISEVDNLSETLQQIQDDLDTAEDNIAGHETRIVTLEAAKNDYEAFKERVRAFLEDANASDTTIDRWHEIENFLQGITDTETLTGLLNDLKQEILREIPEPQTGNYLELVEDLDAYTDAPDGKIVKYVGQTNEKYTRGFDYERVVERDDTTVGDPISWTSPLYRYTLGGKTYIKPFNADISTSSHMGYLLKQGSSDDYSDAGYCFYVVDDYAINEGIKAYENDEKNYFPYGFFGSVLTPIEVQGTDVVVGSIVRPTEGRQRAQFIIRESDSRLFFLLECNRGGKNVILLTPAYEGEKCDPTSNETEYYCFDDRNYAEVLQENYTANPICRVEVQNATSIATWQPIPSFNVIN